LATLSGDGVGGERGAGEYRAFVLRALPERAVQSRPRKFPGRLGIEIAGLRLRAAARDALSPVAVWIEPCLSLSPSIRPMLPVGELVLSSAVSATHRNAAKSERRSTVVECDTHATDRQASPMGEGRRRRQAAPAMPCTEPRCQSFATIDWEVHVTCDGANCARFGRVPVPEMTSVVSACAINAHKEWHDFVTVTSLDMDGRASPSQVLQGRRCWRSS
jgi:hypothetical protein